MRKIAIDIDIDCKEYTCYNCRFLETNLYGVRMWEDCKVIGNIHDNPELLEASDA